MKGQGALATLGAVSGGTGGTITDNTITAADLASGDFSSKITSESYSISVTGNAGSATNIAGGSTGYIPFQTSSSTTSFDSNLYWNNSNKRLGIGTTNPQGPLDVKSTSS